MKRRHILLISAGAAAMAVAAGGFVLTEIRTTQRENWYGFRLGMNAGEIAGLPTPERGTSVLLNMEAPWSKAYLSFDPHGGLVEIDLRDNGLEETMCQSAPCPIPRLKSVAQMRADRASIRQEMLERLGPPSRQERWSAEELTWDFVRPPNCVGVPPPPLHDPSGKLDSVVLHLSDDDISLDVRGHGWDARYAPPPGLPIPPAAPGPPAPPCPQPE
jgi:hypothetical protein